MEQNAELLMEIYKNAELERAVLGRAGQHAEALEHRRHHLHRHAVQSWKRGNLVDEAATEGVLPFLVEHAEPLRDVRVELVHPRVPVARFHDHVAHLDLLVTTFPRLRPPGPRAD